MASDVRLQTTPHGHPVEMWQRQVLLVGVEGCRWGGVSVWTVSWGQTGCPTMLLRGHVEPEGQVRVSSPPTSVTGNDH